MGGRTAEAKATGHIKPYARWELEREACGWQETYGRYDLARQRYWGQWQLRGVARSLAQWAGQLSLECEWRDRVVREERQRWVALGVSQGPEAQATGQQGLLTAAIKDPGLLHLSFKLV